jgi:hypothetical protein
VISNQLDNKLTISSELAKPYLTSKMLKNENPKYS